MSHPISLNPHLKTLEAPPLRLEVFASQPVMDSPVLSAGIPELVAHLEAFWASYLQMALEQNIPETMGLKTTEQIWEVELTLLDNVGIQAINSTYRKKSEPTDVLTFTLFADSPVRSHLVQLPIVQMGEIFVSLEWLRAQASEAAQEKSGELEKIYLQSVLERITHGFLHLMGINHDTMDAYQYVVGLQKQVLQDVFSAGQ